MALVRYFDRPVGVYLVDAPVFATSVPLLAFALFANHAWLDQHMLPDIMVRKWHTTWLNGERTVALVTAMAQLLILRPRLRNWAETSSLREVLRGIIFCFLALGLSLCVAELAVSRIIWRSDWGWEVKQEPLRVPSRMLGWANLPARSGIDAFRGRRIRYDIDRYGHRVPDAATTVDFSRPSILFVGESVMFGHRLQWNESVPGRVEAATGMQSANLAVNAYGIDQDYLHLVTELPSFHRPVAIVMLFSPGMIEREFRSNRPHLDADLRWHPSRKKWRLVELVEVVFPFHLRSTIADRLHISRAVLLAAQRQAAARHIPFLVLVPVFIPESDPERRIRNIVLGSSGIASVIVPLDPSWRLFPDHHPDFRGDAAMANAIVDRLRREWRCADAAQTAPCGLPGPGKPPSNRDKQAAVVPQPTHPAQLGDPSFKAP